MSLSRFLKASKLERALMPPQLLWDRKSTGLTALGTTGNLKRKSNSVGSICLLLRSTYIKGRG